MKKTGRVAFQGEHGAFSEAAAMQLLGENVVTVPRPTFDALFRAIEEGAADALLAPVENTLAGSVVRVYDLLLESKLGIVAETILRIEHHLIGVPGATLEGLKSVASHPVALAQCEKFFLRHPALKRLTVEDTAGSVRDVITAGDKTAAGIAGRRAAERYGGEILKEAIHDNPENYTRFVLLVPVVRDDAHSMIAPSIPAMDLCADLLVRATSGMEKLKLKMSLALRLAHKPGSLLAALEPFARHGVNLMKIESRPIPGAPWVYQFFVDLEGESLDELYAAISEVKGATSDLRNLGLYAPAVKAEQR